MMCKQCGHWNRCPICQGWVCEVCGAELVEQVQDQRIQLRNELYNSQAKMFARILFMGE